MLEENCGGRKDFVLKRGSKNWNRFWSKVNKASSDIYFKGTRCWEWTAGSNGKGYGSFWLYGKHIYLIDYPI